MEQSASTSLCVKKNFKAYQYYTFYFFLYAFIGWLMETVYAFFVLGGFHKRGFLLGPICPLYGFGALILLLLLKNYKEKGFKLFFLASIIFSAFEYITGYAIDALFQLKFWDYSQDFLNINSRISLMYSIIWGFIAIIFFKVIHPFMEKVIKKITNIIPYKFFCSILTVFVIIFIIDVILSCIRYLSFA